MDANNRASQLQVLIERYKITQSKLLTKLSTELERAARVVLADTNLADVGYGALSRELVIADQKVQATGFPILHDYRVQLSDFVTLQAKIEADAWDIPTPDATLIQKDVFQVPLGIDGRDKGKNIDAYLLAWWNDARNAIFGALKVGAYQKENNSTLLDKLRGTKRLSYQDGMSIVAHRSAVSASDTVVQHASSSLRELMLKQVDTHDILWSSLFEKNTCARCGAHDGQVLAVGTGARSPIHPKCRCIMVPVIKGTGKQYEFTYFKWLATQPRSFVKDTLGPTRAALFLDGGLTAARFVALQFDKRFEPISLEQLRKSSASIFAEAQV